MTGVGGNRPTGLDNRATGRGGNLKQDADSGFTAQGMNESRKFGGLANLGHTGVLTLGVKDHIMMWWPKAMLRAAGGVSQGPLAPCWGAGKIYQWR